VYFADLIIVKRQFRAGLPHVYDTNLFLCSYPLFILCFFNFKSRTITQVQWPGGRMWWRLLLSGLAMLLGSHDEFDGRSLLSGDERLKTELLKGVFFIKSLEFLKRKK